ncbi:urease accessory protein [Pontibacter diazotrophicus]|uniref:Urease accessory protein n=1 Tax=Pontibacter diazotrophicus TaxID=1400979 RepID=A0A3D8LHE1_9BACT|nr:urease accessory protein [Pontibacter diazotrophicus]RDV16797.1 urease accessory protein [Pontibacter diazotrophicus]
MEALLPILFAALVGMGHAFEADHLIAVGNIITKRDSLVLAVKDGVYWGLGHTTTLVIVGSVILLSRATFLSSGYFEAFVGLMLIIMGISRLANRRNFAGSGVARYQHSVAYTVGLLHGLAGSGALVLLVMSEISDIVLGITYLLVFGVGSIVGMFIAAGLFSIPFTQRMKINRTFRSGIVIVSSLICIFYGSWMMYQNLDF